MPLKMAQCRNILVVLHKIEKQCRIYALFTNDGISMVCRWSLA